MGDAFLRPFRHRDDGTIAVQLSGTERQLLSSLLGELRERLDDDGEGLTEPGFERLFPVVHPEDPDAEAEWARLVHDELRQSQVASADLVTDTLQAETVTADQLGAWLQSINALRLVLGTRIGVEEDREAFDPDAPDAPAWIAYDWLTQLCDGAVQALRPSLPDELG